MTLTHEQKLSAVVKAVQEAVPEISEPTIAWLYSVICEK